MTYYHATTNQLTSGQTINSTRQNQFYVNTSQEMDKSRPQGVTGRTNALYVTDSDEFAVHYLLKQNVRLSNIKLYEVIPNNPHKCPFAITHRVELKLNANDCAKNLINEYWNPTLSWKFYEYLTDSIQIVKEVSIPCLDDFIFTISYDADVRLAESVS
ncbi:MULTISPECIES: hypothetical protein [unclassified Pseudoalteromonas]|uniref:hypothetical protein n=1 Tax=unclassified Pseudoalteromonas TaxID=194690 RepID=UPI001603645C|nr:MULTISPECIES: hypothetical protein [unclassified Pseudoalteromonas]MBB1295765.1 hypothetical protein [Pseudoalteromonas sp. SR41-4]MDN3487318.1 hypothetical protein [Pseudoalteromonas sp. APC 3224]